jgi:peptide/nickel transport system substrate-binding protein
MQPLPMNEYIQQSLKSCFFNVDIKVVEWNTLFTNWRLGERSSAKGIDAINVSAAVNDPYFGLIRFSTAKAFRRWRPTGATSPRRRRKSWRRR